MRDTDNKTIKEIRDSIYWEDPKNGFNHKYDSSGKLISCSFKNNGGGVRINRYSLGEVVEELIERDGEILSKRRWYDNGWSETEYYGNFSALEKIFNKSGKLVKTLKLVNYCN